MRSRIPFLENLSLGYRFDQDREIVSMIYLNYAFIILFLIIIPILHLDHEENIPITYRYHAFLLISIFNLWMIRKGWVTLVRVVILTLVPVLILILPPLAGLLDDEFYFWFPYVPIALSLIPHFILHTRRHRIALGITLGFYLLLVLFIDNYLIFLSDGSEKIIPIVLENRFYYNLIPVLIFIFVNLAIGIVFAKNYEYEQIVLRQQDELIQSEKMTSLGTLTAGIAHEINNPLNFISGSLHALNTMMEEYVKMDEEDQKKKKEDLLDQIKKIMDNSFEGVKRASDIISSLKFFANPGGLELRDQDLDLLLQGVLLRVEKKIPYNISIAKNIPQGIQVHCYEAQLQQALINIIENAIEAIEEQNYVDNKRIEISASDKKKNHVPVTNISISNNGPAIPEKAIKKVFDPFFTQKSNGKGLGMTICYMIIKEHKGWIEVHNKNEGVIFDVYLPKA